MWYHLNEHTFYIRYIDLSKSVFFDCHSAYTRVVLELEKKGWQFSYIGKHLTYRAIFKLFYTHCKINSFIWYSQNMLFFLLKSQFKLRGFSLIILYFWKCLNCLFNFMLKKKFGVKFLQWTTVSLASLVLVPLFLYHTKSISGSSALIKCQFCTSTCSTPLGSTLFSHNSRQCLFNISLKKLYKHLWLWHFH